MKSLAVLFPIVGALFATQALAEPQPLARADCQAAIGWSWNDTANVCEQSAPSQPLTRADCDLAGLSWNDNANVCGEGAQGTAQAQAPTADPVASAILINIDKSTQNMTVLVDGVERYRWPVSTGRAGYSTPSGTFAATSMNEIWYSKEWDNAPMPHAIFFMKDGHAIHGSTEVKHLGKPASHGCVRLAPENATILYDLVKTNGMEQTQVVLSGETPGGEGKVATANKSRSVSRSLRAKTYLSPPDTQPRKRGGFLRRLFGAR